MEKLRSVDDAFRRQLDAQEQSHQEMLAVLEQKKQGEIDIAHQQVGEKTEKQGPVQKSKS